MKVWIVNMGIGDHNRTEYTKAMRVFKSKRDAYSWVKKAFEDQIKDLMSSIEYNTNQTIGNSFHIYEMDVDELSQKS